ncbi:MAG: hypothetical protein A3C55_05660 [Gammaproteobacteria bacterium RIFCSPHIGHO2_02_FULL_42_13]|nr:MAG: hypothetical protein A3C55_05660 [Gammaproteobacteria bacterium RIFCSPHIGHO2_02_FULL_42_13]OGT71143.1 MAG: hypothetical protein A3H43_01675 [Gammaproteobacteria bacterium RIFCSPLOWO2_02_FULL_42_9]
MSKFHHMRYWPGWIIVGLLILLSKLPYRLQLHIGKFLGLCLFHGSKKLTAVARININLCFPELSDIQRRQLFKKNCISSGIAIMETAFAWYGKESKLRPLLHLHGEEHIQKAQTENRGILFIGPHFLTIEIANRLYTLDHDVSLMYRKSKNDFLNFIIETALKKHNKQIIERNQVYQLIKTLKKGESIGYTPDIDGGYYNSIFVPFFNIPASTLTAPAKIAKFTNATVLLSTYYRRDDGTGYDITFSPVPANFPSDNIEKDITYINQWLEEVIRKKPEQYLWQYKRFKTRPKAGHAARNIYCEANTSRLAASTLRMGFLKGRGDPPL